MKTPLLIAFGFISTLSIASSFQTYDSNLGLLTLDEVPTQNLHLQQRVCVFRSDDNLGCGRVQELYANSATIKVKDLKNVPPRMAQVILKGARDTEKRATASTPEITSTFGTSSVRDVSITAGLNAGLNYYYPSVHAQVALSRSLSLGIEPMVGSYKNDDSQVLGYGGYLTLSYYHTHWVFRGLEFQAGVGYMNINVKNPPLEASASAIAGKGTIGWRGRGLWDLGLDLGVAAGAQYIHHNNDNLDVSLKGMVPLMTAFIGYSF